MSTKVADLKTALKQDNPSTWIVNLWDTYSTNRDEKLKAWGEVQKYLFATDTSSTSNATLPWENTTTLPKLCQIRDVLHANYMSAVFPNDNWLRWEGYTEDSAGKEKADTITSYMSNKAREGNLRGTVSQCLLDYIDYGNAFAMPSFESRYNDTGGEITPGFIGPKGVRIDPKDIVFNPLATEIKNTFKIVRSIKTIGELKKLALTNPDQGYWEKVVENRLKVRTKMVGLNRDDFEKANLYTIDGFGNLQEYYSTEYVEILEFYGDFYDEETKELQTDRMITIVDRNFTVRNEAIGTYDGTAPIYHVGWRKRSNNLWAMGPLDNLVGMQYRIDHLENAKADAFDLAIHAPLVIKGEVEPFTWGPKTQVHLEAGEGDVSEIAKNLNAIITSDSQIQFLEERMELYAGAPREAAGIRTPGEKTAFEVDTLQTAASRIFQVKITNFEVELLEPLLNGMFETAHRNFDTVDVIRTIDNDLGVVSFQEITKADITAKGILRPVGARHFSAKAKELQNLIGVFNSTVGEMIAPHTSGKELANYIDDTLEISGYNLFRPNVAIMEQKETMSLQNQAQEDLSVEASTPIQEGV